MPKEKKVPWYKKKEYFGVAAFVLGGVRLFAPLGTISYQVSEYLLMIGLPLLMSYFGISDAKKFGTTSSISKITDSIISSTNKVKNSLPFKRKK